MAVYYATTQQRTLGRLLNAKDVHLWIRGGNRLSETGRLIPSLDDIITRALRYYEVDGHTQYSEQPRSRGHVRFSYTSSFLFGYMKALDWALAILIRRPFDFVSSDPDDYKPDVSKIGNLRSDIIYHCFTPCVASVITISAPQMLLSSSLVMFLVALAIYFGFLWTRNLDQTSGPNDSRNIFITYVAGLAVAAIVYSVSQLFQNDDKRSERQIVEGYLDEYLANNPEAVTRWRLDTMRFENGIPSAGMGREGTEHDSEAQHPQDP